jgi:DNA-binding response OmpR family regulator
MKRQKKILAVDDDASLLAVMDAYFARAGYRMVRAEDGLTALQMLEDDREIEAIVLDRSLPDLGGLAFLQKLKADIRFNGMPVVMLTGTATADEAARGITAGARYYLSKPCSGAMLIEVVTAALQEVKHIRTLEEEHKDIHLGLGLMREARFHFRTLEEASSLAYHIADCLPQSSKAAFGLHELMLNAVEHGNLGIGYEGKTKLLRSGTWHQEVERRLNLPENRNKFAFLTFEATEDAIVICIKDQGRGFDWHRYLDFAPGRVADPHGRGIAACRALSFPNLEYLGDGNEARCTVPLPGHNCSH